MYCIVVVDIVVVEDTEVEETEVEETEVEETEVDDTEVEGTEVEETRARKFAVKVALDSTVNVVFCKLAEESVEDIELIVQELNA